MKAITGTLELRLSLEQVNHINALIERDTPKAVIKDKEYSLLYCPTCNKIVYPHNAFCEKCGQRLDVENTAL